MSNLEVSADDETVLGKDELEGGRSVLTLDLWILGWLLWDVDERLAIEVESILRLDLLILVLILVEVVVPEGVLEVLVTAVHFEADALVDKHLVLTLAWQLEALIGEDNVLPDLWDLDLLHLKEFFGVVIFIPLDTVEFTKLKSKQEKLVRILNQVIQYVDDLQSHLLDLHQLRVGLGRFVLKLINLVLGLDECLQELWDLSTLEGVVHL